MRPLAATLGLAIMYVCFSDRFPVVTPNTVSGPRLVGLLFSKARIVHRRNAFVSFQV